MDKWDPLLVNSIAASRPVILVDYVGVGLSTGTAANSFRKWADDMIQFLSLIDVKEVDLLGMSLGGFVIEMMALNADPNKLKVRKLILCGTGASIGPRIETTPNVYTTDSNVKDLELPNFKVLFFPPNSVGEKAAEEWWSRIHERNESTSGETPSNWLSQGFKDNAAGMKAQGEALEKWFNPETSRGLEGSYGRLEKLDIPVLIANGSVSKKVSKIVLTNATSPTWTKWTAFRTII
jgi:pimeloyl-ACP methyl ester carboxylesterase